MFGTVLTITVTMLQLYVCWRLLSASVFQNRSVRLAIAALSVLLWVVFFAARLADHSTAPLAVMLDSAGMIWMVVLFLTAVCLLIVDLATAFGVLFRRAVPGLRRGALASGALLSLVAFVQGHRAPVIESFDIPITGLAEELNGTRIVALSDLHLDAAVDAAWLRARVQQVRAERPDLVVILGDVVEGHGESPEDFAPILSGLVAPLGVWGVAGNHESHGPAATNGRLWQQAGIRMLNNAAAEIRPGLVLAGVTNPSFGRENGSIASNIAQALQGRPGGATILLSHMPVGAEIAATQDVSLMLCGHTHGGQVWPFSYLVRLRFPYLAGRYEVGGMPVLVCRGTGIWGPRMRLWSPGSILRITLRRV